MNEKIFVGYGYGNFENTKGQMQPYCNVFMLEDFSGTENANRRFAGQKAAKYRCLSPDVWKDIDIGTRVTCFFDNYQRVIYMAPVDKA